MKQEFRRTDFGSRLLQAAGEGEGAVRVRRRGQVWMRVRGVSEVKQYPSIHCKRTPARDN